jgi:D-xylonolactonase
MREARTAMASDEVRRALDTGALLGEGLHWDAARLWWVDIQGQRLMRWDMSSPTWDEWTMPQRVGWVIPERGRDSVVLGLQQGFARAWLAEPGQSVEIAWIARPFGARAALRLNDAKADATGAIWGGSLNNDDESRSDGCLFRLAPDGRLDVVDTGYTVANGPAIALDGRTLMHTDSGRRTIYAFDLDAAAGRLSNKRVWKVFADEDGYPDGMTFDREGALWVAHWGAGRVSRFDAEGRLLRTLHLPAPNVTDVCFAGPALDRLFVTTARTGLSAEALAAAPLAGALFEVVAPGVVGLTGLAAGLRAAP